MARNPRNAAPAAGGNGPPAAPPAPVRPPRQPGDWTDDRTPNDELFFPNAANTANVHPNAVPSAAATARVRGGRNYTPITYGNLVSEATTYLDDVGNTIDNAHNGGANYSTRILGTVQRTMVDTLVLITKILHYIFMQYVPDDLLQDKNLFQAGSRPGAHLHSTKVNFASRVIIVCVFGKSCNTPTITQACRARNEHNDLHFCSIACKWIEQRLKSKFYNCVLRSADIVKSNWPNTIKALKRRAENGVWSISYLRELVRDDNVSEASYMITQGIFMPYAIYCDKLIPGATLWWDDQPHFMLSAEYNGAESPWVLLRGEQLFSRARSTLPI